MANRKIKIANAGDLQANIDLLRNNNIIKNGGVWELIGHKEVELNSLFYEYKLQACSFDKDEKYYKQLARFTYNRKFWERIFAKLGYYDRIFPAAECSMLIFQKDRFRLILPYFSNISELYLFGSKNPKYPYELPALQREWNYQFKQISDTVLVWANYEEGQYDAIR